MEAELSRYVEAARAFEGWELEFEPEPLGPGPEWSYEEHARERLRAGDRVLDLGTGGGEVFEKVLRASSLRAVATEEWHVNAPVAARRLRGRAAVVRTRSLALPFGARAFDVALSRHEEIEPAEVARVLAAGGRFLTEQVIPDHWRELRASFPDMTVFPDHQAEYARGLRDAGLLVRRTQECRWAVRFRELGHLVYHLLVCPWIVPGFSVLSHAEALEGIERTMANDGGLVLTTGVYLLEASRGEGGEERPGW